MGYLDNNLPLGAKEDPNAPWNQNPEIEIEVLVSITLSKSVKVRTSDYKLKSYTDEDGGYCEDIDLSNTNLKEIIEEQIYLPHQLNIARSLPNVHIPQSVVEDFEGWNVDEFEVVPE